MLAKSVIYNTPSNLEHLLDGVVGAASKTRFYEQVLPGRRCIRSLDDFKALPVTPLDRFRRQRLADVVSDTARVQWIAGAHKGQNVNEVAVAEGNDETAARYEVFKDALAAALPGRQPRSCAVITAPRTRYFAAEVSTILGYCGIAAHVFTDGRTPRAYEVLHILRPEILVILADGLDEGALPPSIELCVTFRRSHKLSRFAQLDFYLVDEFGFVGHSTGLERWVLYNDLFYFEESEAGNLIVSALRNHTQPLLRLETRDRVRVLAEHHLELGALSAAG